MREVISLHIGQAGIQTGNSCWELFCLGEILFWKIFENFLFRFPFFLSLLGGNLLPFEILNFESFFSLCVCVSICLSISVWHRCDDEQQNTVSVQMVKCRKTSKVSNKTTTRFRRFSPKLEPGSTCREQSFWISNRPSSTR
jgi:hypothetical protein